jgi:NCAIR mutase (PurE)-related protein
MAAFIELDHDRARRRGYPEAVYCEGKTPGQVSAVARAIKASGTMTLFTRAGPAHVNAVMSVLPEARYDEDARLLAWPPVSPAPRGGRVLVVAAGTADFEVAREA